MPSQFKFSIDDDRPETILKAKRESLKADKIGQRLTISIFLMILMIGASAGGGYYYFSTNMKQMQTDYDRRHKDLLQDVDSKFSVLSKQTANLESTFETIQKNIQGKDSPTDELLLELERSIISLKDTLKKQEDNIKKLEKSIDDIQSTKLGKQELESELTKQIEPIRSDSAKASASVKMLDQQFARELAEIAGKLDSLETEFGKARGSKTLSVGIDKKILDSALDIQQKKYQEKIDELIQRLEDKDKEVRQLTSSLRDLERTVKDLEKKTSGTSIQMKPLQ